MDIAISAFSKEAPTTRIIRVQTRHGMIKGKPCSRSSNPFWRDCDCMKEFYIYIDGKDTTRSAKTRKWKDAETEAQKIRDSWDPTLQALRALKAEKELTEKPIADAYRQFLEIRKQELADKSPQTFGKYETLGRKLLAWCCYIDLDPEPVRKKGKEDSDAPKRLRKKEEIIYLSQITRDLLDQWRLCWHRNACRVEDRFDRSAAGRLLEKLKMFFDYCVDLGWLKQNPAGSIKAISGEGKQTLPLLHGRYEMVLKATERYDESMKRDSDKLGQEMRALIQLQRWTGMRISDALMVPRDCTTNVYTFYMQKKSGKKKSRKKHEVLIPNHVLELLHALPQRPDVDPRYFFWSGKCSNKSLTGCWQRKLERLNRFLNLTDYEKIPNPIRFHSHQLRDTFAVEMLITGKKTIYDVQKALGHDSIKTTEKHYAAWVPARQTQHNDVVADALVKMGAQVSDLGTGVSLRAVS